MWVIRLWMNLYTCVHLYLSSCFCLLSVFPPIIQALQLCLTQADPGEVQQSCSDTPHSPIANNSYPTPPNISQRQVELRHHRRFQPHALHSCSFHTVAHTVWQCRHVHTHRKLFHFVLQHAAKGETTQCKKMKAKVK